MHELRATAVFAFLCIGTCGCMDEFGPVATVNGESIPRDTIRLNDTELAKFNEAAELERRDRFEWMEAYLNEVQGRKLRRAVWTVLERQAMAEIDDSPAELSDDDLEHIDEQVKLTTDLLVQEFGSVARFVEVKRATYTALGRVQADADSADAAYDELLAPLGIDRSELDVPEIILQTRTWDTAMFEGGADGYLERVRQSLLESARKFKREEIVFGRSFEPTDEEISEYIGKSDNNGQMPETMLPEDQPAFARAIIRFDKRQSARREWLERAVQEADIEILDPALSDVSLLPSSID